MKDISFAAAICPWCHRETRGSQQVQLKGATAFAISAGIGMLIGAIEGHWILGVLGGATAGTIMGGIVAAIATPTHRT
jgi:uncharacterized paraquat-inducible protein A